MLRRQATCRSPATLSPTAALTVLADVPAATRPIGTAAEDIETVTCGALVRDMGTEPTIACAWLLSVCCLHASQDRLRDVLRVWTSSWALSRPTLRTACGWVVCGVVATSAAAMRVPKCGTLPGTRFWMFVYSYLGTP